MRELVALLTVPAMFAHTGFAADLTGTWKAKFETPDGTVERANGGSPLEYDAQRVPQLN